METIPIESVPAIAPPMIVPGILPKGLSVWAGPTGSMKTTGILELGMVVSRITRNLFLGTEPTKYGPVLYLGAEESPYSLKAKVPSRYWPFVKQGIVMNRFHCILDAWKYPLDVGMNMKELLELASDLNRGAEGTEPAPARIVIIDPYANFLDEGDENDNHVARQIAGPLHTWAHFHNAAVVILHHCRKLPPTDIRPYTWDDIRGAAALVAAADGKVIFQRMDQETKEVPLTCMFRSHPSPGEDLRWKPAICG